jgi:hypothetical protein
MRTDRFNLALTINGGHAGQWASIRQHVHVVTTMRQGAVALDVFEDSQLCGEHGQTGAVRNAIRRKNRHACAPQ